MPDKLRKAFQYLLAAGVLLAAAGRPAPAQTAWPDERQFEGIVWHADFGLDDHLGLMGEISRLHREVVKTLALTPGDKPIHIYLFARQPTYRAYVKRWFPHVPYRRALFIKRDGTGMVFAYRSEELATDLRHESTHALLHSCLPMVPIWLDEGLAEYFELPAFKRAHGNQYQVAVKWNARLGIVPALKELEQVRHMNEMGLREYRHAWAWIHFMLHGPPAVRAELIGFLDDIRRHRPPGKLSQRLAARTQGLESEFAGHFRNWTR